MKHNLVIIGLILLLGGFVIWHLFIHFHHFEAPANGISEALPHEHGQAEETSYQPADAVDLTIQSEVTMDIKDFAYGKPNIKIKKGTKVTWTNQDTIQHNVMKEHEHSEEAHSAPTKEEIRPDVFAGPLLMKGESYSFTFNSTGTFSYHCAPHPYMTGLIVVVK